MSRTCRQFRGSTVQFGGAASPSNVTLKVPPLLVTAARLHDAGAQVVVEVAHVPGDLVEDRGQAESEVLAKPPGVAVGDRQTAQVRGGALDNVTVGTNEVDRVGHCSPEVRSTIGTAGGKPTR